MKMPTPWIALLLSLIAVSAPASTTTPNMGLLTPAAGDTDYPTSISSSFTSIDTHDHSSGKGVVIPAGGLGTASVTGVKLNSNVVDNSTLAFGSSQLSIKASGVGTTQIADSAVTQVKRATASGFQAAPASSFSTQSTSFVDVTGLTGSFTCSGRPVLIVMDASEIHTDRTSGSAYHAGFIILLRDASQVGATKSFSSDTAQILWATTVWIDTGCSASSTVTYKIQAEANAAASRINITSPRILSVYEL